MGENEFFNRPVQHLIERAPRSGAVIGGQTELARDRRRGRCHQIKPRDHCPPAVIPAARHLLNLVGQDQRARGAMEKRHFGDGAIAGDHNLIDDIGPTRISVIS